MLLKVHPFWLEKKGKTIFGKIGDKFCALIPIGNGRQSARRARRVEQIKNRKEAKMKNKTKEYYEARIKIMKGRNKDNYRIVEKVKRQLASIS